MKRKYAVYLTLTALLFIVIGLHFYNSERISNRSVIFNFPHHENVAFSIPVIQRSKNADSINDMIENTVREVLRGYAEQTEAPIALNNTYACTYKKRHVMSFRFSVDIMVEGAPYPVTKVFGLTIDTAAPAVLNILQAADCEDWDGYIRDSDAEALYGILLSKSGDEILSQAKEWYMPDKHVQFHKYYLDESGTVLIFDESHVYGDYTEVLLKPGKDGR